MLLSPVNKNHVVGSCKKPYRISPQGRLEKTNPPNSKRWGYDYSLKCYIFALFL
jgi:hypothetical protein